MSPHIVDFSPHACTYCGTLSSDSYVAPCPACGVLTCRECMVLTDNGNACSHSTPRARGVVTTQEWR